MQNDNTDPLQPDGLACLEAAEAFLRQQQGLYGNIMYRSAVRAAAVSYAAPDEDAARPSGEVRERQPMKQNVPAAVTARAATAEAATHAAARMDGSPMAHSREAQAPAPVAPAPGAHGAASVSVRRTAVEAVTPAQPAAHEAWQDARALAEMNAGICACQKCPLGATRTKFVFGVGRPDAGVMVIGEAPGADEDAKGEPFVGKAGQLLNKILEAVKFAREDVFIANILKCRPPNNRRPVPLEVEQCEPYLWKQIELVKPKIILCLGLTAAQTLLKSTATLGALRETVHTYRGIPLVVTYHPAALLRNPNWKRPTWDDVQKFRNMYDDIKAAG